LAFLWNHYLQLDTVAFLEDSFEEVVIDLVVVIEDL